MVMYSFVPPFREATFCGVSSCVFDKLWCATGEKKFAEHWPRAVFLKLSGTADPLPKIISYILIK
jgi:hypothetical protein